jgi:H/ACA ribonucleoprotein complex subunit 4
MQMESLIEWLGKKQDLHLVGEEEDLGFGFTPHERPPELYLKYGVINLDKPPGPTSHQATSWVKRILGVSKAGHGGTLDPMVTGVLPIGIEKATAAMRYIVGSSKEYVGIMKLHGDVSSNDLNRVFRLFRGRIYQRPPQKSSVRRKLRTREIYSLELIEKSNREILFRVHCESGFYVRKLAHDIGMILGVGAHLSELRRVKAGPFSEDSIVDFYRLYFAIHKWKEEDDFGLMKKVVQPFEVIFREFPKIIIKDSAVGSIAYGASLKAPGMIAVSNDVKENSYVLLMSKKGEGVAIATSLYDYNELISLTKGVVATPIRVFIERDLYPPLWKKSSR